MIIKVYWLEFENWNNTLEYRRGGGGNQLERNPLYVFPPSVTVCYLEEASYLVADQTGCRGGIIFLLSLSPFFFPSSFPSPSVLFRFP